MKTISEIIFEELPGEHGNVGLITLNRPQVLNALNHDMFLALDAQLAVWEKKSDIKAVIIRAVEGRAFCAGGDIRSAYEKIRIQDPSIDEFFMNEYRMNSRIHHFPKPYIALLDGITMGGGAGISINGSHRIGTEKLLFAMPETSIGFYPDVGATYFLSRLPHHFGYYLGLVGARISYADCLALGLIQSVVKPDSLPAIIDAIKSAKISNKNAITEILNAFSIQAPSSDLLTHQQEIETCFSKPTMEDILDALENATSEWCQKTAAIIKTKSPMSLKVTLHALQEAEKINFDACMKTENILTSHFVRGHDFVEGIRAVIIDKDQKPQWKPSKLSEISSQEVMNYFKPLNESSGQPQLEAKQQL